MLNVWESVEAVSSPGRDFIWWQIIKWINGFKLQFNAQETTSYLFPLKQPRAAPQGCVCV